MNEGVMGQMASFKKTMREAAGTSLLSTSVGRDVTTLVGISTNIAAADFIRRLLTGEVFGVGVRFLVVLGGEDVLADLFLRQAHAEELILAQDELFGATTTLGR